MPRIRSTTSIEINLADIYESDLIAYVHENYNPEDIYPEKELEGWASDNGWSKPTEEEEK